jgi:predicted nucleic acid-binding protein
MTAKRFLDSNILVYAYDQNSPVKSQQAQDMIEEWVIEGQGVISTQVLTEFYNVVTRKLKPSLPTPVAIERVRHFLDIFEVLSLTPDILREACRGVEAYHFSFLDAQIWSTAHQNGISVIISEDFAAQSEIEGVKFINPFQPAA